MAAGFDIGGILGSFAGLATSQGASGWISLGISTIVSTIIGGIVLLVVMELLSKGWGENISAGRVFLFMFLINIIQSFGLIGLISPYISFIAYSYLVVSLLLWIGLLKLLFSSMSMKHAAIAGIICFIVNSIAVPNVVALVSGFLPI